MRTRQDRVARSKGGVNTLSKNEKKRQKRRRGKIRRQADREAVK